MDKKGEYIVTFVTTGSKEEARKICKTLVEENLIACANIIPSVNSVYRWKGEVCDEEEVLIIAKSTGSNWERMKERIRELHSYEVPEIIAMAIEKGSSDYLNWISSEVEQES